jgi:3-hydroxyisobutyrate dehydrogenase-like beta-hydroxyacid dehydrogenase
MYAPIMSEQIGFLGLGLLGTPMAANLLDAGYRLRVWNRTASKADQLVARGAVRVDAPADVATRGGIVVSCLWDGASVGEVVRGGLGGGLIERLGAGGMHISMATISPEASRELAEQHRAAGVAYVEAPVFGRPEAAAAKQLQICVAGADADKARAKPILVAVGGNGIFDFGERFGSALVCKLAGNFMIGAMAASMSEAIAVSRAEQVDPRLVVDMLTSTLFATPLFQRYGKMFVDGMSFSRSRIPDKDLGLLHDAAVACGTTAPVASFLRDHFRTK